MSTISVRDNENNRWKRNTKTNKQTNKNKDRKEQRGTEAIVKGWELSHYSLIHLLYSVSLTLIIGNLYCLNYILLLLHLITAYLVPHLSLSSIVFIISTLIIGIFYCLDYISLLLHLFITHLVIDFIITM